ncbi:hypothetical protein VRRI112168_16655 [Vreelandella rituensis]|uniref:Phasin domain-containing protein n=1 Tax=Vreelandella rituensis TaxID=2282306 RepID=A0A368U2M6_9GAMM|nr:hypothetical protein [Halomonas rituensis]RCV90727.1 hypothetical protein DU506_11420 [Halomonas rituensis]
MATQKTDKKLNTPFGEGFPTNQAGMEWWSQQMLQSCVPLIKMQETWLKSLTQAMEVETEFLHTLAESGEKLSQCFTADDGPPSHEEIADCYQHMLNTMKEAHYNRMSKVAELTTDFRRQLWDEI